MCLYTHTHTVLDAFCSPSFRGNVLTSTAMIKKYPKFLLFFCFFLSSDLVDLCNMISLHLWEFSHWDEDVMRFVSVKGFTSLAVAWSTCRSLFGWLGLQRLPYKRSKWSQKMRWLTASWSSFKNDFFGDMLKQSVLSNGLMRKVCFSDSFQTQTQTNYVSSHHFVLSIVKKNNSPPHPMLPCIAAMLFPHYLGTRLMMFSLLLTNQFTLRQAFFQCSQ